MRVPNLIELGRSPSPLKHVWVLVGNKVHAGTTWVGLYRSSAQRPRDRCLILNLATGQIFEVEVKKFLETWRPHYFDSSWTYKAPDQRFKGFDGREKES